MNLGSTNLVQLLIDVIILGIIAYVVYWIIGLIPLPAPWKNVALAIFGLILLIIVLQFLGLHV